MANQAEPPPTKDETFAAADFESPPKAIPMRNNEPPSYIEPPPYTEPPYLEELMDDDKPMPPPTPYEPPGSYDSPPPLASPPTDDRPGMQNTPPADEPSAGGVPPPYVYGEPDADVTSTPELNPTPGDVG